MNELIRSALIELARNKRTTTYSELNEVLSLGYDFVKRLSDMTKIGKELEDISRFEFNEGRPPLSVLVNNKYARKPGIGFYVMCEGLYKKTRQELQASNSFDIDLTAECFKFWRDGKKYRRYHTIK